MEETGFTEFAGKTEDNRINASIDALIRRYDLVLRKNNMDLTSTRDHLSAQLEAERDSLVQTNNELQNKQLTLDLRVNELQLLLEQLRFENANLETSIRSSVESKELRASTLCLLKMSIDQLYIRAGQTCRLPVS
jgi:hypothetical protein